MSPLAGLADAAQDRERIGRAAGFAPVCVIVLVAVPIGLYMLLSVLPSSA